MFLVVGHQVWDFVFLQKPINPSLQLNNEKLQLCAGFSVGLGLQSRRPLHD